MYCFQEKRGSIFCVVLDAVENLGGPADTSHLNTPLVSLAALLRMMWVGVEWSSTSKPGMMNTVVPGVSVGMYL